MLELPGRRSILGVLSAASADDVAAAAARVQRVYRGVPDFAGAVASYVALPALAAGVVVVSDRELALPAAGTVVWGVALGAAGPATAAEIAAVLDEPRRVADLGGVFVLARYDVGSLRLVASTDFVFTLRRSGPAVATRAVAALALAGQRAEVDRDAVCEQLALHSVVATGELLTGVVACEEGTVVDVRPNALAVSTAVPLGDRLAGGPTPTPQEFRDVLTGWLSRAGQVPAVALALTAGRDSSLLASCLADAGLELPAVTHAVPGYPDARGARAVAGACGLGHESLYVRYPDGRRVSRWIHPTLRVPDGDAVGYLMRQAAWAEGMQQPRDALTGHVRRPGGPLRTITGHSGEVGRGYFWSRLPDGPLVEQFVAHGPGWHLPDHAKERVRNTVDAEVALATSIGRGDAALDVMFARRQRAWLDHTGLADTPFVDLLPAYLSAPVVRLLLDVPREDRRTSAFFDAALALGRPDPRAVASHAAQPPRWAGRLGRLSPYKLPNDLHLLTTVMAAFEPDGWLVREVLGDSWWRWAVDAAPSLPPIRALLWSSIAIEALHRWLATDPLR